MIHHAQGRIRLLLGTRPHLLPALGLRREQQINLDAERYADPQAVVAYTLRNLLQSRLDSPYRHAPPSTTRAVAGAVAQAADGSFLVARLVAGTLAAASLIPDPHDPQWVAALPRHADQAMAEDLTSRLGPDADRAADLLRPLAYAQGQGLPWEDLWAPIATAVSGRPYTDRDIRWLREAAGSYIIEAVEDDRSLYRLYHQTLAEHLQRDTDPAHVHRAIARVLTDRVPTGPDGEPDWSRAHPYTLRHLATHAVAGGTLDDILTDPEYLVHADPDQLTPHLHHADGEPARLAAAVYRSDIAHHRNSTVQRRRQVLALAAAQYNSLTLTGALNNKAAPGSWLPRHATGGTVSPAMRNTLTGHDFSVTAVACTALDGRPVAVTGSEDDTVRVWDLATGQPHGQPLTGHTGPINAVACTTLDGRPVAVTGSYDHELRIWNLVSGRLVDALLLPAPVEAVAASASEILVCAFGLGIAIFGRRQTVSN
ncbi:WD40 repeat domain-containing protein [Streptacidiphilus sp. PAMC 29251]